ncbi:hypothetical protein HYW41_04360 [Candidatus Daviesbacteria bacterium]|nr:hypothetical protein [Candidatus Daviesbacteria bacterium]
MAQEPGILTSLRGSLFGKGADERAKAAAARGDLRQTARELQITKLGETDKQDILLKAYQTASENNIRKMEERMGMSNSRSTASALDLVKENACMEERVVDLSYQDYLRNGGAENELVVLEGLNEKLALELERRRTELESQIASGRLSKP